MLQQGGDGGYVPGGRHAPGASVYGLVGEGTEKRRQVLLDEIDC